MTELDRDGGADVDRCGQMGNNQTFLSRRESMGNSTLVMWTVGGVSGICSLVGVIIKAYVALAA